MPSDLPHIVIEPLDSAKHRREDFDCGEPALNDFLRARARKEAEARLSACFVAVPRDEPTRIAGFYTLSAATIQRIELPDSMTKTMPRYRELPATLLGRLARSVDFRGQHIGNLLMFSALRRAVEGAKQIASWAILTDPKNERARQFYDGFGFHSLTPQRMYLPMTEAFARISAQ